VQPAEIATPRLTALAVTLRRRSPWEATDLGIAMLQRWWRPVYAVHALVLGPIAILLILAGWFYDAIWLAMVALWWLEPVYDRAVLYVLSRAVFGNVPAPLSVLRSLRGWSSGLLGALTFDRIDFARSFNLPVRQLEGQRGREARARRSVLGRRARGHAVWLTIVWIHFEWALVWSTGALTDLLLPAQLERARGADEPFLGGLFEAMQALSVMDAVVWAAVLLVLEPFYVAAGFGLYLNRRTLLEGWDIEVALRRIAERHAVALILIAAVLGIASPGPVHAQEKDSKKIIAEVLKDPEFGHYRETMQWQARDPAKPRERTAPDWRLHGIGYALAKAAEVLFWGLVVAAVAYALWWAMRLLPRGAALPHEPYRPPPALFGMELAPEKLPPSVADAAAALARDGKLREALSLLYRGALSELVHKRGIELLPSHTEGEAVKLAGMPYLASLVDAWRRCAYAQQRPLREEVERLVTDYKAAFS
jgi:hypothetical protein